MTPQELQAARRILFYSIPEAARYVPASEERPEGVRERAWRQWEDAERPLPDNVARVMEGLLEWRSRAISAALDTIDESSRGKVGLVWYPSLNSYLSLPGRHPLYYRPSQSVIAEAYAETGAPLVLFDLAEYREWLGAQEDTETRRSAWAALKIS